MPFTHSKKSEPDLSQYITAFTNNIPLDKAFFKLKTVPKIMKQLRELMEDSVDKTVRRALDSQGVNARTDKNESHQKFNCKGEKCKVKQKLRVTENSIAKGAKVWSSHV
jgi:hypothetical protein